MVARNGHAFAVRGARLTGGAAAISVVVMVLAWRQTTQTISVDRQLGWMAVGAAGLSVWCLSLLIGVATARRAIALRLGNLILALEADSHVSTSEPHRFSGPSRLVATAGMVRYHRESCPVALGKPVRPATSAEHEAAGRTACGMCEP